jgi:hypothetical protein
VAVFVLGYTLKEYGISRGLHRSKTAATGGQRAVRIKRRHVVDIACLYFPTKPVDFAARALQNKVVSLSWM